MHEEISVAELLRAKGFRATSAKLELLGLLAKMGQPLSIQAIKSKWKGKAPDTTTLYRSLTDMAERGIIQRIDLNTGIAHFEYTPERPHHHHVVCKGCGLIEEIDDCSIGNLENKILTGSKQFKAISSHTLEFFGECRKCISV